MVEEATTIEEWRTILTNLVEAIDNVLGSKEHQAVYQSAWIHGVRVSPGNNFGKELKAAKELLAKAPK